jgi:hypothetical protein
LERRREEEDDARAPRVIGWRRARRGGGWRAALGRQEQLGCARGEKKEVDCCWVGLEWKVGEGFLFFPNSFLNTQPIEFKQMFESKHSKTMHRHECNREFLYFIN